MATIDVLLPVRNGIAYLAESLDSLRTQTFQDWRALVLDHGSTDGTRELLDRYSQLDRRIRIFDFPDATGLAGLLNLGLEQADCRYVVRHDADDVCLPTRMATTCAAFADTPECVASGGQVDVISGTGARLGGMTLPTDIDRVSASSFFRNPIAHPAAAFDFASIRGMGIRYGADFLHLLPVEESLQVNSLAEDYFMFGQLAVLGRCRNTSDKVLKYRWHGGNVGATKYVDQMLVSLAIARFLARSYCARHKLRPFDPAPFCNFGDALFDVDGRMDFDEEFTSMVAALRAGLGPSTGVERELAFRQVVSTRRKANLAWRFLRFSRKHRAETGEINAVKTWLTSGIRAKTPIRIAGCDPQTDTARPPSVVNHGALKSSQSLS